MTSQPVIVFVCEHGAAKSILAATHFNQLAKARGLNLRAVARGTNPDAALSEATIAGLADDGLTPSETAPRKLSAEDALSAEGIVSFCELPYEMSQKTVIEHWDDIPPVGENYERARDAIRIRLEVLIDKLRSSP